MKNYYALYAPHGIRVVYGDLHWPAVYAFSSKADRDKWVNDDSDCKKEACTYAEAKKYGRGEYEMVEP